MTQTKNKIAGCFLSGLACFIQSCGTTSGGDDRTTSTVATKKTETIVTNWTNEAYIKAVNGDKGDKFGSDISISGDTLAVGAIAEAASDGSITNGSTASHDNNAAGLHQNII